MQALVQIMRLPPVDQLCDDLPIPLFIKLIYQNPMELRQVFNNAYHDLQEALQIRRSAQLIIHLREHRKDIHCAHPALVAPPLARSHARASAAATIRRAARPRVRERAVDAPHALERLERLRVARRALEHILWAWEPLVVALESLFRGQEELGGVNERV